MISDIKAEHIDRIGWCRVGDNVEMGYEVYGVPRHNPGVIVAIEEFTGRPIVKFESVPIPIAVGSNQITKSIIQRYQRGENIILDRDISRDGVAMYAGTCGTIVDVQHTRSDGSPLYTIQTVDIKIKGFSFNTHGYCLQRLSPSPSNAPEQAPSSKDTADGDIYAPYSTS